MQCENVDCLKWRRLPIAEGIALCAATPWFCRLARGGAGSCAAAEEDHRRYDQLADRCRLKYVMSALAQGALVWATMAGYCRSARVFDCMRVCLYGW